MKDETKRAKIVVLANQLFGAAALDLHISSAKNDVIHIIFGKPFVTNLTDFKLGTVKKIQASDKQFLTYARKLLFVFDDPSRRGFEAYRSSVAPGNSPNFPEMNLEDRFQRTIDIYRYWMSNRTHQNLVEELKTLLNECISEVTSGASEEMSKQVKFNIQGVVEYIEQDYSSPLDGKISEQAIDFLRGGIPKPFLAINDEVAVPRKVVDDVIADLRSLNPKKILLLLGAISDGVTTAFYQIGHKLAADKRSEFRVFRVATSEALGRCDEIIQVLSNTDQIPVLLFDNLRDLKQIPKWLTNQDFNDNWGHLVMGGHRRNRTRIERGLNSVGLCNVDFYHQYEFPEISEDQAGLFVDNIITHNAFEKFESREVLVDLFRSGLHFSGNYAGLWPAMYQATRGVKLEQKVSTLVNGIKNHEDMRKFQVLQVLVFMNFQAVLLAKYYLNEVDKAYSLKFFEEFLTQYLMETESSIEIHDTKKYLKEFLGEFEGELCEEWGFVANPNVQFRHPQLSHAFFHSTFGSKKHDLTQLKRLSVKWEFYPAYISTVENLEGVNAASKALSLMYSSMAYDSDYKDSLALLIPKKSDGFLGDYILETSTFLNIDRLNPEHKHAYIMMLITKLRVTLFDPLRDERVSIAKALIHEIDELEGFQFRGTRLVLISILEKERKLARELEPDLGWKSLIDAEILDAKPDLEKYNAIRFEKLHMFTKWKHKSDLHSFQELFRELEPLSVSNFLERRLNFLVDLYTWKRKGDGSREMEDDEIKYSTVFPLYDISNSLSVARLNLAVWKELYRRIIEQKEDLDKLIYTPDKRPHSLREWVVGFIKSWAIDYKGTNGNELWGLALMGKIVKTHSDNIQPEIFIAEYQNIRSLLSEDSRVLNFV